MAAPTIYSWLDAGAPQVTRGDVASFKALFQACLIDGYGSKSAPVSGANKWSIPFSDSTSFILKQGGTSARKCCVKLSGFNDQYCHVVGARDFTDLNTPVDVFSPNGLYDRWGLGYSAGATDHIPWMIFATERSLYVFFGYNGDNKNNGSTPTVLDTRILNNLLVNHFFFGDYTPADSSNIVNQMLTLCDYSSTNSTYFSQNFLYNTNSGYGEKWLAGDPQTNLNAMTESDTMCRMLNDTYDPTYFGQVSTSPFVPPRYPQCGNKVLIDKLHLFANNTYAGHFPGMVIPITGPLFPCGGNYVTFPAGGTMAGQTAYQFTDSTEACFILLDGDWGVE